MILGNEQAAVQVIRERLTTENAIFIADIEMREDAIKRERAELDEERTALERELQDLLTAQEEFESDREEFESEKSVWEEEKEAELHEAEEEEFEEHDDESDEDDELLIEVPPVPTPKKARMVVVPVLDSVTEAVERCAAAKKEIMHCMNVIDQNRASADRILVAITGLIIGKRKTISFEMLKNALGDTGADTYIAECQLYRKNLIRRSDLVQELTLLAKEWNDKKDTPKKYLSTFAGCLNLVEQIEADDYSAQIGENPCGDDVFYSALENALVAVKNFPTE